jgi:translocation protein SEC63
MPRFLLKTENHISILVSFFVIILVVIPGSILIWINTSKRLDKNGVIQDNAGLYLRVLNENLNLKMCLFMIAMSIEFQDIPVPKSESSELNKLRNRYLEYIPKRQNVNPRILKVMLLLLAHMDRKEVGESLKKDSLMILGKALNMVESMVDCAYMINMMPKAKKMSIRTFELLIEFSQLLTQGLMLHESNVLMLPGIDESHIKFLGNKKKPKISDLKESSDFKKLQEKLSSVDLEDFKFVLSYLPDLKVTTQAYVDGEEGISEGDLVTVKVTIERLSLSGAQKAGFIHSNKFPFLRLEKLWIIVADPTSNKVYYVKSILSQDRIIEDKDCKFPIGPNGVNLPVGTHRWEVHVKSDCYYGLDVVTPLNIEVLSPSLVKKEVFVHPDDQKIEKQATWIQSVMAGMQQDEESSDEEIPDLEETPEGNDLEDIIDS